ncbi:MAG TPA: cupin domain-containing protein [Candidatus Dormibacteraeota bacterium]|jgi:mannose-6-phosphate isomerase-like protein (cupin superfamily)|nr:cupin domain-containing protein [Candidatus Dormibacteraeota bacterium]
MKKLLLLALVVIPFAAMNSQAPAPAGFEHWTTADLQTLNKTLAEKAATDSHRAASKPIADYPNDLFMLAHREADGQVELHETQVDVFFVQSGSATLLVGGTLVGAETTAPHEKRNGTIQGGSRVKLSPGDVVRIAANTPHQLLLDGAKEFTYFVIKIKNY